MEPIYDVQNVVKVYKKGKKTANDGVTLTLQPGEILGLLGPNGAGKTTLVKQMVAQLRPTRGQIRMNGVDIAGRGKQVARGVAYYSQEPKAMAALTPMEAIALTARLRGLPAERAQREAVGWLERMGLAADANRRLNRLSGGQRRLAGIAAALVGDQGVFILDEPTNELDPVKRKLVWDLVRDRHRAPPPLWRRGGVGQSSVNRSRSPKRTRRPQHRFRRPAEPSQRCAAWPWNCGSWSALNGRTSAIPRSGSYSSPRCSRFPPFCFSSCSLSIQRTPPWCA